MRALSRKPWWMRLALASACPRPNSELSEEDSESSLAGMGIVLKEPTQSSAVVRPSHTLIYR